MNLLTILDVERRGATLIVKPLRNIGCFANEELEDEWFDLLHRVDDPTVRYLVLDFSGIAYFGSTGLEMILILGQHMRDRGGRLVICGLSEIGREIIGVARFESLWPILPTRAEALRQLEQPDET